MADTIPDPRALQNWEDAFRYPIPTVRVLEKKLRGGLEEGRERLRGVVGLSYRELLGTARTIVDINGQLQQVESLLADVSRKSDSRFVEKAGANYARFEGVRRRQDTSRLALVSQVAVLQSALGYVFRLLKEDGSTLLAAKLLVVARLLHKTLSQGSGTSSLVESLGRRLGNLRLKLLRHIDRRLVRTGVVTESLVEDMTAFSLATSSTASDVMKHFQHLRLKALARPGKSAGQGTQATMLRRLQLFLETMREARMIFPDLMGASLRVLGSKPVLKDERIVSIAELDLDIHEPWFSEEVRNFTPYTRQDTSQQEHTDALIKTWGKAALSALTQAIRSDIEDENSLKDVALMRKEVLQTWLTSKRDARGMNARQVLEELRSPFTHKMGHLIKEALRSLQESIKTPITETLQNWSSNADYISASSLWQSSALRVDISDGAMMFRKAIVDCRMGTSTSIKAILLAFDDRVKVLEDVQTTIKNMQASRWDDDFDDDEDDEDDAGYDTTRDSLTRIDPQELQVILVESTKAFVNSIEHFFTAQLQPQIKDCSDPSSPGLWTLRIIRGLRSRLPRLMAPIDKQVSQTLLCQDLVASLQFSIKDTIDSITTMTLARSLDSLVSSNRQARILWDGTPPLPVMPTPATFRYLRVVVKEMETLGTDLWNPELARSLKKTLQGSVAREIKRILDAMRREEEAQEEGDKATAEPRTNNNNIISSNGKDQAPTDNNPGDSAENLPHETDGAVRRHTDETEDTNSAGAPVVQSDASEEEDNYVRDVLLAAPNSLATTPRPSSPVATTTTTEANQSLSLTPGADDENAGKASSSSPDDVHPDPETHILSTEDATQTRRLRSLNRALTHDKLTQLLFDVAYLQLALHCASESSSIITTTTSSSISSSTPSLPQPDTVKTSSSSDVETEETLSRAASDVVTLRRMFQFHPESEKKEEVSGNKSKSKNDDDDEDGGDGNEGADAREYNNDNDRERQRIEKAAGEYWRRTYALFGLLGVS